jgi:hypothetical protein
MENYIEDVLNQLIEEASEIKRSASNEFEKGKLFGYYECISKLLSQAVAFSFFDKLPSHLKDFKPEGLLEEIN